MTKPENSRPKLVTYITTGAVVLVLALIVLLAALSPPAPENVVSGMLDSFTRKDIKSLEKYLSNPVLDYFQESAIGEDAFRWQALLQDGPQLFENYFVHDAIITGDRATITVNYGPGLIQADDFLLRREGRRWKIYGIEN